ncbi:MAG: hypothetical protein HZB59_08210 [Ignavibacteriales bacterium]|nr:hypothetical protein [Ignavibacteriales bacterium]
MRKLLHKFNEQTTRLIIVFVVLIGLVLLLRSLLSPSLKDHRIHVQKATEREMGRQVQFSGSDVCATCHEEYNLKKSGYHKNLSCETCHGTAKAHTDNPTEAKPYVPRNRDYCTRCHAFDPSRPTGFPQINSTIHNPMKPCFMCHNPHDPKPPNVPQDCQACHAEIARTKAISSHVMLECTICHEVPTEHKVAPRNIKASIPVEREFCGKCHGKQSNVKEATKIDLATHGEKYLCWQCHYPHMPEVE